MPAEVEAIAYNLERGVPWHGLGTAVDGLMTAEDCIVKAGLDWTVEPVKLQTVDGFPIPDKRAQIRSTDHAYLGTVGIDYATIQNRDAFGFANAIVAENPDKALYDTAGSLRGGRMTFLSMDLSAVAPITIEADPYKTFLLLANAHDGSKALNATITPVRVVCMNTLNAALSGGTPTFVIRHSGSVEGKLAAARDALGLTVDYVKRFEEVASAAMKIKVADERAEKVLRRVFRMSAKTAEKGEGATFEKNGATKSFEIYQSADDLAPFRGTAWGLVNAVAQYVDHDRVYRGDLPTILDRRMTSILWGNGQQAVNRTLALVAPKLVHDREVARAERLPVLAK